jgi:hypothetical protein
MPASNLKLVDPPGDRIREEDPMNTLVAPAGHGSQASSNLRIWRAAVFGSIAVLYVASLFVPPLRDALAKIFSYFPQ